MDVSSQSSAELQVKPLQKSDRRSAIAQFLSRIVYAPVYLFLQILSRSLRILRPFSPQIIPLVVCSSLVPLVILFSVTAGWIVWGSVAVAWEYPLYLQYGDGVPPYATMALPALVSKQHYDISLRLVVPATESNFALGNFMTGLTLSTRANKTITSVRRPAIALPPPVSFLSSKPSVINIEIPLLTSFAPGASSVMANIELGRLDSWKSLGHGEGREISVQSASLRGSLRYHGIRGLVTRFPVTFAFVSATLFLVISLLILGACVLPAVFRSKPEVAAPDAPPETTVLRPPADARDSSSEDEKLPRRRRTGKARLSRSSSRRATIKAEVPATSIPSAGPESAPLRRRRSRLSEQLSDSEG